jgi:hypothetical protein
MIKERLFLQNQLLRFPSTCASTALLEQNLSKQHPETAAQNTSSSDVFCLWKKSVCAERNINKTVQYILYMKPQTINHIDKHICEAHSALWSRNEETTAALWDVTSCSLVNTHQWYGRTCLAMVTSHCIRFWPISYTGIHGGPIGRPSVWSYCTRS